MKKLEAIDFIEIQNVINLYPHIIDDARNYWRVDEVFAEDGLFVAGPLGTFHGIAEMTHYWSHSPVRKQALETHQLLAHNVVNLVMTQDEDGTVRCQSRSDACAPRQAAVIPARTNAGVLGIARTTAEFFPNASSKVLVSMLAAMEIRVFSLVKYLPSFFKTSVAPWGFTASTMISHCFTNASLFATGVISNSRAAASRRRNGDGRRKSHALSAARLRLEVIAPEQLVESRTE